MVRVHGSGRKGVELAGWSPRRAAVRLATPAQRVRRNRRRAPEHALGQQTLLAETRLLTGSKGNGRMARALQTLVLGRSGTLWPEFSSYWI